MKHLKILLVFLLFYLPVKIFSQSTPEQIMEYFFTIYEEDTDKAIDYFFTTNTKIDTKLPGIQAIKDNLNASRKLLGNYYGYDLATKYYAGEVYAKYCYTLKYDRQPVKMVVFFYKPDKIWKAQSMNFVEDYESDFKVVE
ncbi:MAG: hypothetical protein LBV69_10365 [Bacteroidales bacterium]|jgi:hypothetical protein|nr:hypothetical protein [Bacteroidales bacterium]